MLSLRERLTRSFLRNEFWSRLKKRSISISSEKGKGILGRQDECKFKQEKCFYNKWMAVVNPACNRC